MKEMGERPKKNKYLHVSNIKLKNILKKIEIDVDIPREKNLDFFKWIAKKAIWIVILLFFSVLTIVGCLNLLLQYTNGVTTTTIDISKDRLFPFPTSTVCVPLYGIDFYKLDENFNIENASQFLHSEVSEYFVNHYHDKERFLNGSLWSPAMLSVVYNYVSHLHFVENYEWMMETGLNFLKYKMDLQKEDWWEAGRTLEKEITMLNISISELTEAVGQAIAVKFSLRITFYTVNDERMDSSYFSYKTSFVGSNWICYNVDFSGLVITSQDETIVVEVDVTSLKIALKNDSVCYVLFAPSVDLHMDLKILVSNNSDDYPFITDDTYRRRKNYYLESIGIADYISYDLIQMYRFMPIINGRQQCSEVRSTEVCRAQCRASLIKNLCNCTATSLTTSEDISSECTLTTYGNCSAYYANNELICDCLKPCTRWDYEMKELASYYSESHYSGRIIIRLAKFDYRIFEQTYLWKTEGFIGAFGGAFSLWLGIDFLMVISFFSLVIAKLIKMILKSKQPSSSSAVINQGHTSLKKQDDEQKENQVARKKDTKKRIPGDELLTIKAIKRSNWNCFKILSLIVNLIFSLATVVLSTVLFQKYFSDPPIIEMSVPYDEAFELPKLTEIILPMSSIDLELNINSTLYGEKVEEYFGQHQMNKEAFLNSIDAWPPEIFALCFNYLFYLSAVEGTEIDYRDKMNFSEHDLSIIKYFMRKPYTEELYDAAFQLEEKLNQMEITIKELKLSVAEKIKTAFQLSVKYVYAVDGVVTKENVSIIKNTCLGDYRVCFKADFSNKPLRNLADYIEVSSIINQSILPINTDEYPPSLTVDFYGRIMRDPHDWYDDVVKMEGAYGFSTTYKVFTIDAYRKIPSVKGETKCINYEKKDQCRWQCRSEMIYKKCNCTTVSLELPYLPLGPECSFSIYETCLQYTIQDDMKCIKQCLKPCEKWKYQVDMEKRIALENKEAIIKIQVKKFDYAMYVEKLPWTFETFAGSIGGALSLWLGLDFVILIGAISELIGYILAQLLQTLGLEKTNAGTMVPESVQSNGASKRRQEESNELYFTSAIFTWSKKCSKTLRKARYSLKLIDILKLTVVMTFWGFLSVLFCFLTFGMCFLTFIQYLKSPTTVNMQFLLNNTFIMPTSTLCVPVVQGKLDDMLGFGENTDYESIVIQYFIQNQENKEEFLNAIENQWPLSMYSVIYRYLYAFNTAEGYILASFNSCPIDLTSSRLCPDYFPLKMNEWKALFELESILKRMNVSRSELLQSYGQQTLQIYNISVLHIAEQGNKHNHTLIEIREMSSVDQNMGVCFKINFSGAVIRSEVELYYISVDSNGLHDDFYYWIFFDMYGRYKVDNTIDESFYVYFGNSDTYIIGAKEFDQIFSGKKEDPDCNEYVSPEICRSECRARVIKRLCNCTAASLPLREASSLSDECTLAAYQNCLKYYAADDFECRKNCLRSCRREPYQWKFESSYWSGNDNKLNLILRVEQFGYATFEEVYKWGLVEFLGEFGGNLGLWMGLDVKMFLGEIFAIFFVIGKHLMAFINAKVEGNAVIVI